MTASTWSRTKKLTRQANRRRRKVIPRAIKPMPSKSKPDGSGVARMWKAVVGLLGSTLQVTACSHLEMSQTS